MKNSWSDKVVEVVRTWKLTGSGRYAALFLLALLLPVVRAAAQTADTPEMADALRTNGKIYVVVAVVAVVLMGLLALLVSLDRKVSRLERELKE